MSEAQRNECPLELIVMLEIINNARSAFIATTNHEPTRIYMTLSEMKELSHDLRGYVIADRERDLRERLHPDLLPPMRDTPEVTAGCFILGMEIIQTDTPGLHLAA